MSRAAFEINFTFQHSQQDRLQVEAFNFILKLQSWMKIKAPSIHRRLDFFMDFQVFNTLESIKFDRGIEFDTCQQSTNGKDAQRDKSNYNLFAD